MSIVRHTNISILQRITNPTKNSIAAFHWQWMSDEERSCGKVRLVAAPKAEFNGVIFGPHGPAMGWIDPDPTYIRRWFQI